MNDRERTFRYEMPGNNSTLYLSPSSALGALKCVEPGPCHGESCNAEPVIIPPTGYKMDAQRALQGVWRRAAARLAQANSVFVMGYSWPPTDHFFHQLYAIGSVGVSILSRFWVCDPDESVRDRFRAQLLGQQALDCFGPSPTGRLPPYRFDAAIARIAEEFDIELTSHRQPVIPEPGHRYSSGRLAEWIP